MTEQEREELKRKIEARKQREAAERAKSVNSNQQTCPGCGSVIPANYDVCPVCGKVLRQGTPVQNTFEQNTQQRNQQAQRVTDEPGTGFAIASVVLGGVGLLLVWFVGFFGPICGGVGYALAEKAIEKGCQSNLPKIGRILSIVSMAISLVFAVGTILLAVIAGVAVGGVAVGAGGLVSATLLGVIFGVVIGYGIPFGIAILIGWLIKKYV